MTLKPKQIYDLLDNFDELGNLLAGKTLKFDCKAFTMTGTPTLRTAIELLANGAEVTIESAPKRPREVWLNCRPDSIGGNVYDDEDEAKQNIDCGRKPIRFIEDTPREVTEADVDSSIEVAKDATNRRHEIFLMLQHYEQERSK